MKSESEKQGSPKPSVLAALASARVMTLEKIDSGRFVMTEGCDGYFAMELSRDQMLALAAEIRSIADHSQPTIPSTMTTAEEKLDAIMKEADGGMRPKWFTRATPIVVIDEWNWKLDDLEIYAFRDPDRDEGWTVEDRTKRDSPEWLVEGICTEDQLIKFLLNIHRERRRSG